MSTRDLETGIMWSSMYKSLTCDHTLTNQVNITYPWKFYDLCPLGCLLQSCMQNLVFPLWKVTLLGLWWFLWSFVVFIVIFLQNLEFPLMKKSGVGLVAMILNTSLSCMILHWQIKQQFHITRSSMIVSFVVFIVLEERILYANLLCSPSRKVALLGYYHFYEFVAMVIDTHRYLSFKT